LKKQKYKFDVGIVGGAGHVGLPLGIFFGKKKLKVLLNDKNKESLNKIKKGIMPFIEHGAKILLKRALKDKKIYFDKDNENLFSCKFIVLTIGTPIDEFMQPKTKEFVEVLKFIVKNIKNDQYLIIRSSVYPNLILNTIKSFLPKRIKNIVYCPERIVQGYALKELETLPQIIATTNNDTYKVINNFFTKIGIKTHKSSFIEAELLKLFSNSFRYIQFAVANQFYMMSESSNANFSRVRYLMTVAYPRAYGIPSSGFSAGPCLFKDTMQLAAHYNNKFLLGNSAMMINESLPSFIVEKIESKFSLIGLVIGLLGMAFKANIDDTRDSLSFKLKKILESKGAIVLCNDPFIKDEYITDINNLIKKSKILILTTPHSKYKNLKFPKNKKLIDPWFFFSNK